MEHLPRVVGSSSPLFRTPCVCDPHSFGSSTFEAYPESKGYKLIKLDSFAKFILNSNGSRLSSEQLADISQAWPFFGLVTEMLKLGGVSIDPEDFIERDGDSTIHLSTKRLPHYLGLLEQTEALLPTITRKSIYRRQQDLIMKALCFRFHQISDHWVHDSESWRRFMKPAMEAYKIIISLPIRALILHP